VSEFVHLHIHSEYSLLDGAQKLDSILFLAREFNMPALALTDHGNLFGAIEFYKKAKEFGLKPIIGCEVYCAPTSRKERRIIPQVPESSFHLTLLAQDFIGYKNLVRLVSLGYLEGFYYRPRIDKELLGQYGRGLICLSGCRKGEIPYYLAKGEVEKAKRACGEFKEIFGENFFLEVMRIGLQEEEKIISGLCELGRKLGVRLCATNDCHYLSREDRLAHEVMLCLQTNKKLMDSKRLSFSSEELFFKSPEEMKALFSELPEAVKTTQKIAEMVNLELDLAGKKFHLPDFPLPPEYQSEKEGAFLYLSHLAWAGLKRRYSQITRQTTERLKYELSVIKELGFANYFLVIKDIIDFARRNNIPVGPGRGSAVGSLCLYCLGITDCDPLKYDLLFERFMNPQRVSLPDIDIDFGDKRREEVISYIKEKYGEDKVTKVITFGTLQARAVVRDVGRVLSLPLPEIDFISKLIPDNVTLTEAIEGSEELRQIFERNEFKQLKEIALKLEGQVRHASIHASGIIITPFTLWEMIPVYKSTEGEISTQYDMNSLQDLGIVKMDILGLKTLTVIQETAELIQERGLKIELDKLPLNDEKTYSLLKKAQVLGVFQLESYGMREILKKLAPEKFEDLIAVISLYRPGPLSQGNVDEYILRKKNHSAITYPHPLLEDILKETYGMIVYQEQVMRIAATFAGFSLAQADVLRQAMGKKNEELMKSMREDFIKGACERNIPRQKAEELFSAILPFSGYAFNKSHSVGYATIAYITAFLLANYPKEFICVSLTNEIGAQEKIARWLGEIKEMGIPILPPDVNYSFYHFTCEGEAIRFGLGAIKNIGKSFAESIVRERKNKRYDTLLDLILRTKAFGNRKSYEYLIKAGALSSINPDRQSLLESLDRELERANSHKREFALRQFTLFDREERKSPFTKRYTPEDILHWEKDALGFYLTSHPLERNMLEYESFNLPRIRDLGSFNGQSCIFAGLVISRKAKRDKKGDEYLILRVEDLTGNCDVLVFGPLILENKKILRQDNLVLIKGKVRVKMDAPPSCRALAIIPFSEYPQWVGKVILEVSGETLDLQPLKSVISNYPGTRDVFLRMPDGNRKRLVRLKGVGVEVCRELLKELRNLPKVSGVRLDFLL